ncbi:FecR family protein [Butyricimonas virosa]|jgi:sigma factor regulatory protein, fecR/pupR family|uniref:FecR family protein n=2 Tax=Butyricimonas virosa TaxID=544645 RepID=A0A415QGU3_9BACT|nr:FecR domain-containing protein [Butyricimonas virosa]MCI7165005.1 FecR domain-containing protein [Butyricimonas virosa]RGL87606.1 FecR family protein [Butyricimonas virosa]RGY17961.1 FecR family protein [Butyricimonas virosa]RHI18377.1 FecR family protein [Butyricimonas virosa]RHM42274.1 FecR family protein [Butyricimonas virosa]
MERMDINNKKLVDDPFLLASWIAKSMAGELSDEELQLLDEWRMTSARNHQLYDRIVSRERREAKRRHFTAFDKVSGWQGYSKKLKETEKKVNRWRVFLRYAAILLIPLSATVYGVLRSGEETVSLADLNAITPGGTRAELVLPSGEVVDLVAKSGVISRGENTVINNEGKTLSYKSIGNQAPMDSLRYNEVIVPKGGEYQLVLSDGTLVYLNSMTKIRFPERFSEKCREVEVCGEAFFEVAENKRVPFVVKTDAYEITVLGTKFNVTAYADEQVATTTLVEGAVSISGKCIGEAKALRPNEQFVLDRVSGSVEIKNVDVNYYTAWKDGMFRFRDVRLEEIMHVVERWYDMTVVYEDESVRDLHFGFNMSRLETIEPLLNIFELNGKIKITKEGKVLKIKRGR